MTIDAFRRANLANWNERVPIHATSLDYGLDAFAADPARLSGVVDFDRRYLNDVRGQRLLHLQCHIGTDTLSWAKLGAEVTGYDFSRPALEVARGLAERARIEARFVEGEVYDAPELLAGETYDVVYTSVGALCWLPDIAGWARAVAALLAPGGTLLIRDGHPMLQAIDHDRADDQLVVVSPYFETAQPQRWDESSTYTDNGAGALENSAVYEWNHGIGEVLTAVLDAGLQIRRFEEHRELEWRPWPLFAEDQTTGRYALPQGKRDLLPLMYTLVAQRPG